MLLVADGPVDAAAEPVFELPGELPSTWLSGRVDMRLADAEISAAERVRRDSWKDWLPTGTASLPAAVHHPGRPVPAVEHVGGGGPVRACRSSTAAQRRAAARQRESNLELTRIDRADLERRIRADERIARDAVQSTARALDSARRAAAQADEVRAHHRRRLPRRRDDEPRGDRRAAPRPRRRDGRSRCRGSRPPGPARSAGRARPLPALASRLPRAADARRRQSGIGRSSDTRTSQRPSAVRWNQSAKGRTSRNFAVETAAGVLMAADQRDPPPRSISSPVSVHRQHFRRNLADRLDERVARRRRARPASGGGSPGPAAGRWRRRPCARSPRRAPSPLP